MNRSFPRYLYRAFGLVLASELPLPELLPAASGEADPDVVIVEASEAPQLPIRQAPGEACSVIGGTVVFHIPDTATFSIRQGRRIAYTPVPHADEGKLKLYLLGSCMGAILLQRGILPLHGSAIVADGSAVAFVGESGAGKSTLAASLTRQGFPLLSDDVIALRFAADGTPSILPAYPQQKLWKESLQLLDMDAGAFVPLYRRQTKFAVPCDADFHQDAVPLTGIYELVASDTDVPEVQPLAGLERMAVLYQHTYRNFLIPMLDLQSWHFQLSTRLAGILDFYQIRRPHRSASRYDLSGFILPNLRHKGV